MTTAASIRLARPDDAGALLAIYAPIVLDTPISFELDPPSEAEFRQRITQVLEAKPWLVCEAQGQVMGYAYATTFRTRPAYQWSVETSAYVHADHRGKGVGRALYTSLLGLLELQGYRRVLAGITLPNPASVALHESVGFRAVGVYRKVGYKFGAWHDVGWWQLSDLAAGAASDEAPSQPLSLVKAAALPDWKPCLERGLSLLG